MADTCSVQEWIDPKIKPHVRNDAALDIKSVLHLNGVYSTQSLSLVDTAAMDQLLQEMQLLKGEQLMLNHEINRLRNFEVESVAAPQPHQALVSETDQLQELIDRKLTTKHTCSFPECPGFYVCGVKNKHPEHTKELVRLKKEYQKIEKEIKCARDKHKCLSEFSSNSELTFFKVV